MICKTPKLPNGYLKNRSNVLHKTVFFDTVPCSYKSIFKHLFKGKLVKYSDITGVHPYYRMCLIIVSNSYPVKIFIYIKFNRATSSRAKLRSCFLILEAEIWTTKIADKIRTSK